MLCNFIINTLTVCMWGKIYDEAFNVAQKFLTTRTIEKHKGQKLWWKCLS
jgi:hypothetical protein